MPVSDELKRLCHHRPCLRPVEPEDAGFIHGLRMDPAYNAHLDLAPGAPAAGPQLDTAPAGEIRATLGA